MQRNEIDNKRINIIVLIATFTIFLGIILLSYNYVQAKKIIAYEYMKESLKENNYEEEKKEEKRKEEIEEKEEVGNVQTAEVEKVSSNENTNDYIGYLEIPKINFKKGFVGKDSKENNVEKNLFVTSDSTYPDVEKGNLIIAGHSGTGYKAFFKNLYKLNINDIAKVGYNGKVYTYKIVKIYEQRKTGRVTIHRDYEKQTLTLITCTKDNDDNQTIYILELENIE